MISLLEVSKQHIFIGAQLISNYKYIYEVVEITSTLTYLKYIGYISYKGRIILDRPSTAGVIGYLNNSSTLRDLKPFKI
jgi:hypothetical protein